MRFVCVYMYVYSVYKYFTHCRIMCMCSVYTVYTYAMLIPTHSLIQTPYPHNYGRCSIHRCMVCLSRKFISIKRRIYVYYIYLYMYIYICIRMHTVFVDFHYILYICIYYRYTYTIDTHTYVYMCTYMYIG